MFLFIYFNSSTVVVTTCINNDDTFSTCTNSEVASSLLTNLFEQVLGCVFGGCVKEKDEQKSIK